MVLQRSEQTDSLKDNIGKKIYMFVEASKYSNLLLVKISIHELVLRSQNGSNEIIFCHTPRSELHTFILKKSLADTHASHN